MTLNFSIRKLIKTYIDSGLTAAEIYSKLNKTVPRTSRTKRLESKLSQMIKFKEESHFRIGSENTLITNRVNQSCFLMRNGLTKMASIIVKTTASMPNHEKQQTKILAQDLYISFRTKSWYGLESPSMELPTSEFHSMRTFTSKTFYQ